MQGGTIIIPSIWCRKKKTSSVPRISVGFGDTETASDFGSVCLAETKSEVQIKLCWEEANFN